MPRYLHSAVAPRRSNLQSGQFLLMKHFTTHDVEHLLWEMMFLGLLLFPFAIVLTLVVGLAGWLTGGVGVSLWASSIVMCGTLALGPPFVRASCGPDTRVGCEHCSVPRQGPSIYRDRGHKGEERRAHPRKRTRYDATFSGRDLQGSGIVLDWSTGGCRVRCGRAIRTGQFLDLCIRLPGRATPLTVWRARVAWSNQNEFGVAFPSPPSSAGNSGESEVYARLP